MNSNNICTIIYDRHYNLVAILLLRHLIIPDCIINNTLTLIKECQADDNFADWSMFSDENFASYSILVISFKLAIKARCPVRKRQIIEGPKNRNKMFLYQQMKQLYLFKITGLGSISTKEKK